MAVKQILNEDVSNVVSESLAGYIHAYNKLYKRIGEYTSFIYKGHRKDKARCSRRRPAPQAAASVPPV